MKFIRANYHVLFLVVLSVILLTSCSSPIQSSELSESQNKNSEYELEICINPPEFAFFDLQAASVMQILIGDDELVQLGLDGATALADDLFSLEGGFCGLELSDDLAAVFDEIQTLIDAGQKSQAEDLIDELLFEIENEQYSITVYQKIASPVMQPGREQTRRKVQALLALAGRADYWGNDEKFQESLDSAQDTYKEWASDVVDSASIREALLIAGEAQILGIDGIDDRALERARDLAEFDLSAELELFNPCSAPKVDVRRLQDAAARALLLGVEVNTYEITNEIDDWIDIKRRRAKGEDIPECAGWNINLELSKIWESGDYYITWDGKFKELEDGSLAGQGTGTIKSYTEVLCVNVMTGEETMSSTTVTGSFIFKVEGKRDGDADEEVFKFLLPAKVEVSGVDTCNDFDSVTYLPAYVIEEIHTSGGVENYDPETDQIYLVLPAVDGASAEFETIIGPVVLTLSSQTGDN